MAEALDMRGLQGTVLAGRYRLDRFLGMGGFGAVYQAAHLAYGLELREVALKLAKRPMDDREARDIFKDALWLARLAHSTTDERVRQQFVAVYDAGHCPDDCALAGHPYMTMEFIRGGSLASCLGANGFPLRRAISYFDQILAAVAYMHTDVRDAAGRVEPVVHRDLKPDNILVVRQPGRDDILKITDFGLAVSVDALLGWVESGGDLCYLAPESLAHNICSPQSDVYALGLVFYEMIAGSCPFGEIGTHLRGSDESKHDEIRRVHIEARQRETFPALERHEELSHHPALIQVIRTALAVDMAGRQYANARQLQEAWEAAKRPLRPPPPPRGGERDVVLRLLAEAEQCLATGDAAGYQQLLAQALEINRDASRVSDGTLVGRCYLLATERLLGEGQADEAAALANEGYLRRRCQSTIGALARCYEYMGRPAPARKLRADQQACVDAE